MTTQDWILIISAVIVGAGWFISSQLDRKNNIFLKRLDFRGEALRSFIPAWSIITKNDSPFLDANFLDHLQTARMMFLLYLDKEEIEAMEHFIGAINDHDLQAANRALRPLIEMIPQKIRKDLRIR